MYVLAIDQGTTGTTTALYDRNGRCVAQAYRQITQIYPKPGWVEHDPLEIWQTVVDTVEEVCAGHTSEISAVGITNQRETTILWDQKTGTPIHNAIVWQCRRTAALCEKLSGCESLIKKRTGLPVDAYFSGTKIRWMLDHVKQYRLADTLFGTVDSWLIWKLTGGAVHATDYTNAARTMLFNIHQRKWDQELGELLQVPRSILPEVRHSIADYGEVKTIKALEGVPVLGVAGDQQAALFGQNCFDKGQYKNTYGTGCFIVVNTGDELVSSQNGLVTTLAVSGEQKPCYALEGSIFIAGAAIQWLRDELKLLDHASDSEKMALRVDDNAGVYMVPAFVGLGAPHWDMKARGLLTGLTQGANRNHIVRAVLESIAYQSADVVSVMNQETGLPSNQLAVDGGACANNFLMQFQADILNQTVVRPQVIESTSLGVAYMAGLKSGIWKNTDQLKDLKAIESKFTPSIGNTKREQLLHGWHNAVEQCVGG